MAGIAPWWQVILIFCGISAPGAAADTSVTPRASLVIALAAALSVEAAQPEVWGAAANGLRLSLSVTGEKFGVGQEIAIRLRNDGPKEVLISRGNGNGPTHFKLRL